MGEEVWIVWRMGEWGLTVASYQWANISCVKVSVGVGLEGGVSNVGKEFG